MKHLSSQKTRPGAAGWWHNFFIRRTDDNNVKIECTDALCGEQRWVSLQLIRRSVQSPMHTTACAAERNWSKWGLLYAKNRSCLGLERATKTIFLKEVLGLSDDDVDELDLS